ncbi:response regulator [Brumimicrobium oceani]|uniref:DNA-binding response regulator n=1 Tax=Brumimicrobium oceani TaxID=2100725 RepID=A0A2U2XC05_9FLAO|nr:response regulator transcription factor [Brumimicrobium oceani]PWH85293.1 DNA-binding response regulator [Brumimicrobium oceani]
MIRVAVAEDNIFLAKAITEKIELFEDLKLKYIAENGAELIGMLAEDLNVDIILMDIQMPQMDGIEATQIIRAKYPQIKIVMLTVFNDDENVYNAIKAGANGYLLKDTDPETLHKGLVEVLKGGASMNPSIALKALNLLRNPLQANTKVEEEEIKLTNREQEVLGQIAKGLNHHQIAENLVISSSTVRKHIENVYKKMQVHNKVEAIQKGLKNKLIS